MGRCVCFSPRAAIIACACAVMLMGAHAFAQSQNDDRYGFNPMPAPVMPVAPLPPPMQQRFVPPSLPAAQGNAAPAPSYAPPASILSQRLTPPPIPLPQSPAPAPYGFAPASQAGTSAPAGSQYGPQIAANPSAYYAPSGYGQVSGYVLGPGDKLRVSVFGEDDLSGEYQVDGSGLVRLPLVGTLRAAGYTAPALENAIAGALAQGYLKTPRVNVEISTYRPFYIIGAVNRPGEYAYVANMTALNAVAFGGGFTDQAKQSVVYVRHEGSMVEEPASQLTQVWPGDVIRVKNTLFWDAMSIFTPLAGPAALAAATIR